MRVLFFAQAKDAAGTSEMELKTTGNCGTEELWRRLIAIRPQLDSFRSSTRLARNGEYAGAGDVFSDTDEVALIPPVSGG